MRSGTTPALITLTASCDSPPAPREANGGPLSERSRYGAGVRTHGRPHPAPATHDPYQCAPSPGSAADSGCRHRSASAARNGCRRQWRTSPGSRCTKHHSPPRNAQTVRSRAPPPQTALDRQSRAIEQRPNRARRRPRRPRPVRLLPSLDLHGPPARMRMANRNAALGDLFRQRLRMMQRCPRAVDQILSAAVAIAQAIWASLAADPKAPAHRRKRPCPAPQPPSQSASAHPSHRSFSKPSAGPSSPIS